MPTPARIFNIFSVGGFSSFFSTVLQKEIWFRRETGCACVFVVTSTGGLTDTVCLCAQVCICKSSSKAFCSVPREQLAPRWSSTDLVSQIFQEHEQESNEESSIAPWQAVGVSWLVDNTLQFLLLLLQLLEVCCWIRKQRNLHFVWKYNMSSKCWMAAQICWIIWKLVFKVKMSRS